MPMHTADRAVLPPRRPHVAFDFVFSRGPHDPVGHTYTAGVGYDPEGRVAEVFLDCHKLASAMTDDARDAAVLLSIALQHGVPLATIEGAVTRQVDGRPAGLIGAFIEALGHQVRAA